MPDRKDFRPGEFCWFDHNAHDLDAASAWYGELFGWECFLDDSGHGPPYGFFMLEGAGIGGIGQMTDEMKAAGVPPMWNAYVCTDDCETFQERVVALGGDVVFPTTEIPGRGKLAFFRDPGGAVFAAWQSLSDEGAGVRTREPNAHCWTELMTRDAEGAQRFYGELCGWSAETNDMGGTPYTTFRLDGEDAAGMMAMDGPQFEGVPPHWMVYFAAEDCDALAAKVEATGGKVLVPPTAIPIGRFAVVADPAGGVFALATVTGES